jgi:hypothetical protein
MREGMVPGIFISDGTSVRIPEGGLRLTLPRGDDLPVEASRLTLELALDMWPHWHAKRSGSAIAARNAIRPVLATNCRVTEGTAS